MNDKELVGDAAAGEDAGANAAEDTDTDHGAGKDSPADDARERPAVAEAEPSAYRRPAFALVRAALVLAIAAALYQAVVPYTHVVRARLANLVVTRPGVAVFDVKPAGAAELAASESGLAAVQSAATKSPDRTGAYAIEWTPTSSEGAQIVAFLLPTEAQAATTLAQVRTSQLGATSFASASMTRRSTATVPGVPGSATAVFTSSTPSTPARPGLAVAAFQYGRTVARVEVVRASGAEADSTTLAVAEYAQLRRVEPHFSLKVLVRPTAPTILWAAGALALAILFGLGPVAWRWRTLSRERRRQEELERFVVVKGQAIAKRRR